MKVVSKVRQAFHIIGRQITAVLQENNPNSLLGHLLRLGNQVSLDQCRSDEKIICLDVSNVREIRKLASAHKTGAILIRQEPEAVCPKNFEPRILRLFDHVIDVGRHDPGQPSRVVWPQNWPNSVSPSNPNLRSKRVGMVNAFKYSFIKGNQYGLRIAVAASSATLDVFGLGWNAPSWRKVSILVKELVLTISAKRIPHLTFPLSIFRKPRSYLGVVSNKLETLSNYKAALIIENDPAFLTEKIFDSFFAGCIPIYVGKEAAKFEIPAHLFVEADVTIQSVQDAMVIALNMDYLKWRSSLDTWLNDERTKEKWSSERVLPRIAQMALEFNTK